MTDLMQSIYPELRNLVSRVAAKSLTGRWVDVHFKASPLDGSRGLAFSGDNGRGVIFVDPDFGQDAMLKTTLHELAHIKLDFQRLAHIKTAGKLRGLYPSEVGNRMPGPREKQARDLAESWYSIAGNLCPDGDYIGRMLALSKHFNKGK